MHSKRVKSALARLPEVDPAIAALALWCSYRDGGGPTTTEDETIWVGPEFPLLPISEQTGVISHHVMHVALRHSARRAAAQERYGARFQPKLYDLACDALVNEALLQARHALPRPCVRAAELAEALPPEDRPKNLLAEWDSDTLYATLAARSPGQSSRQEPDKDDAIERYMQAKDFKPDLKGADADRQEPEIWTGRVEQALQAGQRAGTGIGAVLARFGDLPQAKVPWEIALRRLLNRRLVQDPALSYRRPARGWLARDAHARQTAGLQPAFEPAQVRDLTRPRVVIGLDTSSSVTDDILDIFASEVLSITRRTGADCTVLGFDTEVHSRIAFNSIDALNRLEIQRGGGTDFAPMLAEAEGLDPTLIIVLTDLDAPTDARVTAPVLWAVPAAPAVTPSFGTVLVMDDIQEGLPVHPSSRDEVDA